MTSKIATPSQFMEMMAEEPNISISLFCGNYFPQLVGKPRGLLDREIGKLLGVTPSTCRDWGSAPNYEKMPAVHRRCLTLIHYRFLHL